MCSERVERRELRERAPDQELQHTERFDCIGIIPFSNDVRVLLYDRIVFTLLDHWMIYLYRAGLLVGRRRFILQYFDLLLFTLPAIFGSDSIG